MKKGQCDDNPVFFFSILFKFEPFFLPINGKKPEQQKKRRKEKKKERKKKKKKRTNNKKVKNNKQ